MKVIPALSNYVKRGEDTYYCATIQIAWDKLRNMLLVNDILTTDHPYTKELNRFIYPISMLDEARYIAIAGLVPGIFYKIEIEMLHKFGEIKVDVRSMVQGTAFYIAFAYLNKLIKFDVPFKEHADPVMFKPDGGADVAVKGFGYNMATDNELYIYRYGGLKSLCIRTKTDTIVFTELNYDNTLGALIDASSHIRKYGELLAPHEIGKVAIPYLSFDSTNELPEVCGAILNAPPFTIEKLIEHTKFELDECGVKLESYALIYGSGSSVSHAAEDIIFDASFLVELYDNRDTFLENPYFVYYVQTPNSMKKF